MKPLFWIIGAIFVAGMVFAGCIALVHKDDNSLAPLRTQQAYHERSRCYDDEDCGDRYYDDGDGYSQRYDQNYGSRDDRNRNRNRDRGAFSPGPFRDSPVTICLPYSCNSGGEQSGGNRDGRRDEPPPNEGGYA